MIYHVQTRTMAQFPLADGIWNQLPNGSPLFHATFGGYHTMVNNVTRKITAPKS